MSAVVPNNPAAAMQPATETILARPPSNLWRDAGIRHFRLEFVHESGAEVARVTEAFTAALAGRITTGQLNGKLRRAIRQGTTEGSLFVPPNYTVLPVLQ